MPKRKTATTATTKTRNEKEAQKEAATTDVQTKKEARKETKITRKPITKVEVLIGTGRRKTAVARVWLKKEKGPILVNDKPIEEYFPNEQSKRTYEEPLRVVNRLDQFSGTIKLVGGGSSAQLGAVVHGLTRALASYEPSFREILAKKKLLTRDPRMKERRKYGHAGKARKKKQSPKR
jgi:small subunit ribosomal protein S9